MSHSCKEGAFFSFFKSKISIKITKQQHNECHTLVKKVVFQIKN